MKNSLVALLLVASAAHADPRVAVTISPIHFVIPFGEVTTEVRVAPKLGIAVIAGAGMVRLPETNSRVTLLEGGASARYYVTGSFRKGIQLGAEAAYVHASADDGAMTDIRAEGLGLSPFAGYKWTHHSGFTLDGQLGVTYIAIRAKSATASAKEDRVGPMLNLNVGYSF